MTSAASSRYDALLFYDMNQQQGPHTEAIEQILAQGKPAVFLHHPIGSYLYLQPGQGPQAFSHPIFETLVRRSLLWSAGNLKGGPQ